MHGKLFKPLLPILALILIFAPTASAVAWNSIAQSDYTSGTGVDFNWSKVTVGVEVMPTGDDVINNNTGSYDPNLVFYHKFDDLNADLNILDSTSNHIDCGAINSADISGSGLWDTNAGWFEGTASSQMQFSCNHTSAMDFNILDTEFTISTWLKTGPENPSEYGWITTMSNNHSDDKNGWGLVAAGGGGVVILTWVFFINDSLAVNTFSNVFPINEWHHIVVSFNGKNSVQNAGPSISTDLKFYVDGILSDSSLIFYGFDTLTETQSPIKFGESISGNITIINSRERWIDEFKYYDRVLTPAEIQADYNAWMNGKYYSKVFDAESSVDWSTMEWGETTDENNTLTVDYRSCNDSACSGESWATGLAGGDTNHSLSAAANRFFQYTVNFDTNSAAWDPWAVGTSDPRTYAKFTNASVNYNNSPATTVTSIDGNPDNTGLPLFTVSIDGNLTIAFNAEDADAGDTLTVDINYSEDNNQGSGTAIVDNLTLGAAVCDDADLTDTTACSWDWDITGVADGNYYINILLSDGTLTDFNASDNSIGIYTPGVETPAPPEEGELPPFCGDKKCNGKEWAGNCPKDCGQACGDTACTHTESILTCPLDCFGCGDGICAANETSITCLTDCPAICGDNQCAPTENCLVCNSDCGTCSEINTILEQEGIAEITEEKLKTTRFIKVEEAPSDTGNNVYKSTVTLRVENVSNKRLGHIELIETIPKEVVQSASLIKSDYEFEIVEDDPVIQFNIESIGAGESVELSYYIASKIEQTLLTGWTAPVPQNAQEVIATQQSCVTDTECDDSNPCTAELCIQGQCGLIPIRNDAPCGFAMACYSGNCAPIGTLQANQLMDNTVTYIAIIILILVIVGTYYSTMV